MPKREKTLPRAQYMAIRRKAEDAAQRLRFAKASPVELSGGGLVRAPRHLRCSGCRSWLVKGSPALSLGRRQGYLCARCSAPEEPEDRRSVAAFDAACGNGDW